MSSITHILAINKNAMKNVHRMFFVLDGKYLNKKRKKNLKIRKEEKRVNV